nr:putative reverse transcriptase domain-containing protein [Tanacetum cinerariifolium]
MLKGLDKKIERKEDGGIYLAGRIWVPGYGNLKTLIMNEAHATRYSIHPGSNKSQSKTLETMRITSIAREAIWLTTKKISHIKDKLKDARNRQKSYADKRKKPLEFSEGEYVLLKVSPWKGVVRFGKKEELEPRFVGPFEITERISPVAYRLRLHEALNEPAKILKREFKKLKQSRIAIVKVR